MQICRVDETSMVSSLAPHKETLATLGIETNVNSWFGRVKLDIYFVMGMPAYKSLVYEFFSLLVL